MSFTCTRPATWTIRKNPLKVSSFTCRLLRWFSFNVKRLREGPGSVCSRSVSVILFSRVGSSKPDWPEDSFFVAPCSHLAPFEVEHQWWIAIALGSLGSLCTQDALVAVLLLTHLPNCIQRIAGNTDGTCPHLNEPNRDTLVSHTANDVSVQCWKHLALAIQALKTNLPIKNAPIKYIL